MFRSNDRYQLSIKQGDRRFFDFDVNPIKREDFKNFNRYTNLKPGCYYIYT